jgi:hypothetical protein
MNGSAADLRKRFETLRAVAALRGVAVDAIDADGGGIEYVVTRWALTRRCRTLDELAGFLARMGIEEPAANLRAGATR